LKKAEMKRVLIIVIILIPTVVYGQQFPFMEGYSVNPFSLSPAYAGIHNNKTLFMDYRSDWTGLDGGPTTYQLSYNDKFAEKKKLGGAFIYDQSDIYKNNVGLGVRFIYDKTDIFKQTLLLGTYTYEVRIAQRHLVNFGLSAGFFRNSIDLEKYYNDPRYVQDKVLISGLEKSKIKFATDISALYRYKQTEAGILFSNIIFGTVRYSNTDMTYKPLKSYLLHASYLFVIDNKWTVKPTLILRGGQNIPAQAEIAPTITWNDRFWGTALFRTGGIFGVGLGGEVYDGIILNYTYNLSTSVSLNTYNSHQLSLGVRIFKIMKNKKNLE
jgi:type IX secretion system PorP/SprF family membrane protein